MKWLAVSFMLAIAFSVSATEAPDTKPPTYPLWDGQESVEQYAKRTNLPPTKTLDLGNGVNLELVLIPAGKFVMGTPEPDPPWIGGTILAVAGLIVLLMVARLLIRANHQGRRPQFSLRWLIVVVLLVAVAQYGGFRCWRAMQASRYHYSGLSPAHEVTLTMPFYVGVHEVTQLQYEQVMGSNPSRFKGPNLPVEGLSWEDAKAFCKDAEKKTRAVVRLPSEAEWEYACRAGTTTTYYTGDSEADLKTAAWYAANGHGKTHPVGQKTPNAWGVYDMHGNLWECCADWEGYYYRPEAVIDPQGPPQGRGRVIRGGSWFDSANLCQSVTRFLIEPGQHQFVALGFRVVVEVPKTPYPYSYGSSYYSPGYYPYYYPNVSLGFGFGGFGHHGFRGGGGFHGRR